VRHGVFERKVTLRLTMLCVPLSEAISPVSLRTPDCLNRAISTHTPVIAEPPRILNRRQVPLHPRKEFRRRGRGSCHRTLKALSQPLHEFARQHDKSSEALVRRGALDEFQLFHDTMLTVSTPL
jgi:hypothetical protein